MYVINLPGSPGVGNRQGQHGAVLTRTSGGLFQGDPGKDSHYPEVRWSRQMTTSNKGASLHGYLLTWCQGPLQPYVTDPSPHRSNKGDTN